MLMTHEFQTVKIAPVVVQSDGLNGAFEDLKYPVH